MRMPTSSVHRSLTAIAAVVVLVVGLLVVGRVAVGGVPGPTPSGALTTLLPQPSGSLAAVPAFTHAYLVVREYNNVDEVVGNPAAPAFNALRERYAALDVYQGVAHPSQPNYLALVAGSTMGVLDDEVHDVDGPTIFDQLEAAGRDWRVYAENVPPGCFAGADALDGVDGDGQYVRKHNPAISFTAIREDPQRCAKIEPLTAFDPAAADLEIIIPNECHDGHDCAMDVADAWLDRFMTGLLAAPSYQDGGAVFVVFDEADGKNASNRIPVFVASESIAPGTVSTVAHDHYSVLRTLQDAWGLPCLAASCSANTVGEIFGG
jgi:acid phosphatase